MEQTERRRSIVLVVLVVLLILLVLALIAELIYDAEPRVATHEVGELAAVGGAILGVCWAIGKLA